jgi:hypothetical protein
MEAVSVLLEKHQLLKEAADLAAEQASGFEGLSDDILSGIVIQTIHAYQKKLNVGVQDSVSDLMDTFKEKVLTAVFNTASGWRLANRDFFLFPRGCRFCFTKGTSTIFVIEQDPQVRTLLMDAAILGDRAPAAAANGSAERVALALPYVIFIIHVRHSLLSGMYCGWRGQPLRTMQDMINMPVLPNIHDNMNVCMGTHSYTDPDAAVTHFWNTRFNNDLSTQWWSKAQIDPRLATARTWARNSLEDSTFVLGIRYQQKKTLEEQINLLTAQEEEPDENALRHNLAEAVDSSTGEIFAKIMKYFKKTKFEKHHPKEIKEVVGAILKEANHEYLDLLASIRHELDDLKEQIRVAKENLKPVGVGHLWEDYSP